MKKALFAIAWLSLFTTATAQVAPGPEAVRQEKSREKKAAEDALDKARHEVAVKALEDSLFILHVDRIGGGTVTVEPLMNFVILEKDKITVQISLGRYGKGSGIALEGQVVKTWKKTDRKGRLFYRYDIISTERSLTRVNITLEAGSAQASGVVYSDSNYNTFRSDLSNYRDRNITLDGQIDSIGSDTFRRKSLF